MKPCFFVAIEVHMKPSLFYEKQEAAVQEVLRAGFRTKDLHQEGTTLVGTAAMGDEVVKRFRNINKS